MINVIFFNKFGELSGKWFVRYCTHITCFKEAGRSTKYPSDILSNVLSFINKKKELALKFDCFAISSCEKMTMTIQPPKDSALK